MECPRVNAARPGNRATLTVKHRELLNDTMLGLAKTETLLSTSWLVIAGYDSWKSQRVARHKSFCHKVFN